MNDPWSDRLSEYLDNELPTGERQALEAHLAWCAECTGTLEELRRVVARAQTLTPYEPGPVLWEGVARRIGAGAPRTTLLNFRHRGRFSFTIPQLAAATLIVAALSGGIVWRARTSSPPPDTAVGARAIPSPPSPPDPPQELVPVRLADVEYDAAVGDLLRALKKGRGRLDPATIAIVEQNLKIIDQAIEQARQALVADPANTYLSGHLVETRRKKLNLLRRAAALTTDTN